MKKLISLFLIVLFASPVFADDNDDYQRKLLRDRQKTYKGREALRQKREEAEIDYDEIDRKNAELRKKEKERLNRLTLKFDDVVFSELKRAQRYYDNQTVSILEEEARKRYEKNPNLFYTKARIYIILFNVEYLQYRYDITKLMYERPRIRKQREDQAEVGLALVDKLLEKDAADPELWRIKGIFLSCLHDSLFSKEKNYKKAELALKQAVELSPDKTKTKLTLAQFYTDQPDKKGGDLARAEQLAQQVLKEDPENVDALLIVGRFYQDRYDYGRAYQFFKKALAIEPRNPEVNYYYALSRADRKRYKKLMK